MTAHPEVPGYTGPELPPEFWHPVDLDGNPMEPPGLGLSKYILLSNENWAFWCGVWHDCMYDLRSAGMLSDGDSARIDKEFHARCLEKAKDDLARNALSDIWFGLVVLGGELRWPNPEVDPRRRLAYLRSGMVKTRALRLMGELVAV